MHPKRRTIPLVNFFKSSDVELHPDVKEEGVRRNRTREFKLECVRQVATGQKRPAQICREHDLSQSVLLRRTTLIGECSMQAANTLAGSRKLVP